MKKQGKLTNLLNEFTLTILITYEYWLHSIRYYLNYFSIYITFLVILELVPTCPLFETFHYNQVLKFLHRPQVKV